MKMTGNSWADHRAFGLFRLDWLVRPTLHLTGTLLLWEYVRAHYVQHVGKIKKLFYISWTGVVPP